jgi:DNA-binding transcriptional ArsR family regulator
MSRARNASAVRFSDAAPVFAALGEATRLALVARLCTNGPLSITRLQEGTGVTRQAVTKHLRVLEGAGLVRSRRRGRERIWQLDERRIEEARRYLAAISAEWDDALGRLRKLVES